MYKTRDMHRAVLNELYEKTIQPVIESVREHMAEKSLGAVEAALAMAKALPAGSQSQQLLLVAAIEIVEPTQAPAKGDEPVREQRVVTNLAADVPAGDGSAVDPLYEQAVAVVRTNQRASISPVQRHLLIGYNRAARLLEAMEGSVVGPMQSNGNRELLAHGGAA
ncbi:DNA translocase FtsK [Duganella sp. Leaf126]|uniref:DNA translocase FtsK n=1 Tax=Duganella sp. Leaf126 TaxID=1736266 RepID=UPI0027D7DB0E|nr:DNA translocase FtsK [Duganella sp. Leaf126]